MRPNYCLTMLHMSILATLLLTLEADSEDSICEIEVRVRRNTGYEVLVGEDIRINCTVVFCNNPPPQVSWYKRETNDIIVNVNSSNHIKIEWEILNHLEGMSFLIFKNIFINDSGEYLCRSGGSIGHAINVSVHGGVELTTVTWTPSVQNISTIQDTLWPHMYRVVGVMVFVIIVIIICVTSKYVCKGSRCAEESRDAPDPSSQPSHHALSTIHIYDNDQ